MRLVYGQMENERYDNGGGGVVFGSRLLILWSPVH